MKLTEYAQHAINEYGPEGDQTFEYLGIILDHKHIIERRMYHVDSKSSDVMMCLKEPYKGILEKWFPLFSKREDVRLCDFSIDCINDVPLYRIVFYLPYCDDEKEAENILSSFFQPFTRTDYRDGIKQTMDAFSRVRMIKGMLPSQIGAVCDQTGNLSALKYYIRWSEEMFDEKAYLHALHQASNVTEKMDRDTSVLFEHNFRPAFVGINDNGKHREEKEYFITKSLNIPSQRLLQLQISIINELGLSYVISKSEITELFHLGLFVEGVALSSTNSDIVRLYFNLMRTRNNVVK